MCGAGGEVGALERTSGESVTNKICSYSLAGQIGEVLKIPEIKAFLSTAAKRLGFPFVSKTSWR